MTTKERLAILADVCTGFPELGVASKGDLEAWVAAELGAVDALERWQPHAGGKTRTLPPSALAHVLAGNLPVSGLQSVLVGLVLGAHNVVKLPTEEGDAPVARRLREFTSALPEGLRATVALRSDLPDEELRAADGVIAHGSDEAMAAIHARLRWDQRFLAYGHKLSLIWMSADGAADADIVAATARDVAAYDQRGCLSPQLIFLAPGLHGAAGRDFCDRLAQALQREAQTQAPAPLSPAEAAAIHEARDTAAAKGARLWQPEDDGLAWTVAWRAESEFAGSPGGRFIQVRPAEPANLPNLLRPLRGKLSTVGHGGALESVVQAVFVALGVHRFCPVGHMQAPPVWWHHDGRPQLAPLVQWVDAEA
ncbi:MAG: acyl-CoA reductase [Verrucomicrobiota bacterium]